MKFKIIFTCRNCKSKFYFNNKFHRHVKKCIISTNLHVIQIQSIDSKRFLMIDFINRDENHHLFVFRFY